MAARNIRLQLADYVPAADLAGASPAMLRAAVHRLGEVAMFVKKAEITAGIGADGKRLPKVKPRSRPDGATGKPLDPHYADSRTIRLLAVHDESTTGVTLYWRGHGRKSWTTILGYHADGLVPGAPVRDTIGISPAGRKKIRDTMRTYWRALRAQGEKRARNLKPKPPAATPAPAPKPKAAPKPPARPVAPPTAVKPPTAVAAPTKPVAATPTPSPSASLVGSGKTVGGIHYLAPHEKRRARTDVLQVYTTGRRGGGQAKAAAKPQSPRPAPPPAAPPAVVPPRPAAVKAPVPRPAPKPIAPPAAAPVVPTAPKAARARKAPPRARVVPPKPPAVAPPPKLAPPRPPVAVPIPVVKPLPPLTPKVESFLPKPPVLPPAVPPPPKPPTPPAAAPATGPLAPYQNWKPAGTLDEAKAFLRKHHGITNVVDSDPKNIFGAAFGDDQARLAHANALIAEYNRLRIAYPRLQPSIDTLYLLDSDRGLASVPAKMIGENRRLAAKGKPWTAAQHAKIREWEAANGRRWGTEREGTQIADNFRHELGHTLTTAHFERLFTERLDEHPDTAAGLPWFRQNVSEYAATDMHEAIAETFGLYTRADYVKGTLPAHLEQFLRAFLGA